MEKEFVRKPGDQVWVMHDNKAVCGTITEVFFCHGISCFDFTTIHTNETCKVTVDGKEIGDFKLDEMFTTKKELIDFLR